MNSIIVSCPCCSSPVVWEEKSRFRPFCCKRCQLIDLGEWVDEENRIPDTPEPPNDIWAED